jgi:hypothetical protein
VYSILNSSHSGAWADPHLLLIIVVDAAGGTEATGAGGLAIFFFASINIVRMVFHTPDPALAKKPIR